MLPEFGDELFCVGVHLIQACLRFGVECAIVAFPLAERHVDVQGLKHAKCECQKLPKHRHYISIVQRCHEYQAVQHIKHAAQAWHFA